MVCNITWKGDDTYNDKATYRQHRCTRRAKHKSPHECTYCGEIKDEYHNH